jgi:hypothetical protein
MCLAPLLVVALCAAARAADPPPPCALEPRDAKWLQDALDAWSALSGPILGAAQAPPPWMVFYDPRCVFHVAAEERQLPGAAATDLKLTFEGKPVRVLAQPHGGEITLPSGGKVRPEIAAATSLHDDNRRTFFFAALPEVWRAGATDLPRPEAFAMGVVAHELTHTLQLVHLVGRIEAVQQRFGLPEQLDDDIIQTRYEKSPRFTRAWQAELAALHAALAATSPDERRRLARAALKLVRARQDRFYRAKDRGWRPIEEIFLTMEGLAVWAHWKLAEQQPDKVFFDTRTDRFWSQAEGFALVRLVDLLEVPDWRRRLLPPEMVSPLTLLDEALASPVK